MELKLAASQSSTSQQQSVHVIRKRHGLSQYMEQLACDLVWRFLQSLSEPTADDPFRFLFGALGFESSSSCNNITRSETDLNQNKT